MNFRKYTYLWLGLSLLLVYESLMLNTNPTEGFLGYLKAHSPGLSGLSLAPEAGHPISLALGWAGIGTMLLTNFYVLRKRIPFMRNWGSPARWLDFHIFCGMLGPTLIVFHTNFRVHGLVAISFWSMVVVALSGVVGRYFYLQVNRMRSELEREAASCDQRLQDIQKQVPALAPEAWSKAKEAALRFVGGAGLAQPRPTPPGFALTMAASLLGDLRLALGSPPLSAGMPPQARELLRGFALARRRAQSFDLFKQYLGYWHSFHLPFAYFMYAIAAIHVATALIFGVSH